MPRTSTASSQQPFGTQNGRKRRNREEEEDEEDEEEVNVTDEEEAEQTQRTGGMSEADLRKKAAKLIRFALGVEHNKKAFQRSLTKTNKFIPEVRQFPIVLARAQEVLKKTMGMELVELRPKYKIGDDLLAATQATQAAQTQATQSNKKKGKGKGRSQDDDEEADDSEEEEAESQVPKTPKTPKPKATGFYILRSILPTALLEQMSNPAPIELASATANAAPDEVNGSLIDWEGGDGTMSAHPALLGIRTVILSLILVNNRAMSDDQLHGFLKRLSLERDTPLPYKTSTASGVPTPPLTLDKYLDLLDRQLYLQKVKIATPGQAESHSIEWRWGQRHVEFSEKAAGKFIEDIMFYDRDEEEEAPARGKRGPARPAGGVASVAEQRKKMKKDLERAAGSELAGDL